MVRHQSALDGCKPVHHKLVLQGKRSLCRLTDHELSGRRAQRGCPLERILRRLATNWAILVGLNDRTTKYLGKRGTFFWYLVPRPNATKPGDLVNPKTLRNEVSYVT
jgi:hypothetical protein